LPPAFTRKTGRSSSALPCILQLRRGKVVRERCGSS